MSKSYSITHKVAIRHFGQYQRRVQSLAIWLYSLNCVYFSTTSPIITKACLRHYISVSS